MPALDDFVIDDFGLGREQLGQSIQPLMQCRAEALGR